MLRTVMGKEVVWACGSHSNIDNIYAFLKSQSCHTFCSESHLSVIFNYSNNHHHHPASAEDVWEKQAALKMSSEPVPSLKQSFFHDGRPFSGRWVAAQLRRVWSALEQHGSAASFRQACRRQRGRFSRNGEMEPWLHCDVL